MAITFPPAEWARDQVSTWLDRFPLGSCFRVVETTATDERFVLELVRHPAGDIPQNAPDEPLPADPR